MPYISSARLIADIGIDIDVCNTRALFQLLPLIFEKCPTNKYSIRASTVSIENQVICKNRMKIIDATLFLTATENLIWARAALMIFICINAD